MAHPMTLTLRCPQCGLALSRLGAFSAATVNVRRKCRHCRTHWSITVQPLPKHDERFCIHKVTFTAYDPGRTQVTFRAYDLGRTP